MAFEIAEKGLAGGGHGGGHHGGGHGGGGGGHHGHHGGGYWGGGYWGGGPWYYDSYPTVYAEPIYLVQDIKADCGANPCLINTAECQAQCKKATPAPVSGLGTISETLTGLPPWVLVVGAAVAVFGVLKYFGR